VKFIFQTLEVFELAKTSRNVYANELPMPATDYQKLLNQAEVSRACIFMISQFEKDAGALPPAKLRENIITEMKALRAKTDKKEKELIPKPLMEKILKVVWGK